MIWKLWMAHLYLQNLLPMRPSHLYSKLKLTIMKLSFHLITLPKFSIILGIPWWSIYDQPLHQLGTRTTYCMSNYCKEPCKESYQTSHPPIRNSQAVVVTTHLYDSIMSSGIFVIKRMSISCLFIVRKTVPSNCFQGQKYLLAISILYLNMNLRSFESGLLRI